MPLIEKQIIVYLESKVVLWVVTHNLEQGHKLINIRQFSLEVIQKLKVWYCKDLEHFSRLIVNSR